MRRLHASVISRGWHDAVAISAGIRGRQVPSAVAGLLLGYVAITLAVAAGVGALVASRPSLMAALTVAGAAYLAWIGYRVLRHPPTPAVAGDDAALDAWHRWMARGFGVSALNPKALLLFLAILPQFASGRAPWPIAVQIAVLGLVHIASCAAVYLIVGYGAKAVLRRGPRPRGGWGRSPVRR